VKKLLFGAVAALIALATPAMALAATAVQAVANPVIALAASANETVIQPVASFLAVTLGIASPYAFVGFGRGGAGATGGRSRPNRAQLRTARLLRAGSRATGRSVNRDRAIRRGATITRGRRVA